MRVILSKDAPSPRIPPTSSRVTALVSEEESSVLSVPPANAVGAIITSNQLTEGAQAQPRNETDITAMLTGINTSSRKRCVNLPTKTPCVITERKPT